MCFKAKHLGLLTTFEKACDQLDSDKKRKHNEDDDGDVERGPSPAVKKQRTVDNSFAALTQHSLDQYVMDYIVDSVLPVHHVDTSPFQQLIRRLTSGRLRPRCRQTFTNQLEERFQQRKVDLKKHLEEIGTVCTTADCWTSRRRSFLGVTVHWIEKNSLERRGACLAVRQITGSHTYDVIAKELEHIHEEFGLTDKICFTVTDSGSNFIKAFKHFGLEDAPEFTDEQEDMEYHVLDDILNPQHVENVDDDQVLYRLPPHWKCACHALNLVAAVDSTNFDGATLKKTSVQTFAKLTAIWNKQNRSTLAAEKIRSTLGTLLPTPGDTRWNSIFDAVSKINGLLSSTESAANFDKLCDDLDIKRMQGLQKTFISEYVEVMRPVCCALDVLQGDKAVGLGYLLPTITVLKQQLEDLQHRQQNALVLCGPLVVALKDGINKRFEQSLMKVDAQLSAVVNPKFKLDWISVEAEKAALIAKLKRRVRDLASTSTTTSQTAQSSSSLDATQGESPGPSDFFARITAARRNRIDTVGDDINSEVDRFLDDGSSEITSLNSYPHIKQLFVSLNTGLPASAAVERLFSLGGRVFSPLRTRLSAEHFEMMVFLRLAKWQ